MKPKKYTNSIKYSAIAIASLLPIVASAKTTAAPAAGSTGISIPSLQGPATLDGFVGNTVNILIGAVGTIAVIMVIVGGLQYVLSAGESAKSVKAKDTILYAVIGVVITILAYSIVNFAIANVK